MPIQRMEEDHNSSRFDILRGLPSVGHKFDAMIVPVLALWEEGDVLHQLQVGFGQIHDPLKFVVPHAQRDAAEVLVIQVKFFSVFLVRLGE